LASTENDLLQIKPELIWREVDNNTVIVSPEDGDVIVLSATGSIIWKMLADKKGVNEIESHLVNDYIVSAEKAKSDIQSFVQELKQAGFLR